MLGFHTNYLLRVTGVFFPRDEVTTRLQSETVNIFKNVLFAQRDEENWYMLHSFPLYFGEKGLHEASRLCSQVTGNSSIQRNSVRLVVEMCTATISFFCHHFS